MAEPTKPLAPVTSKRSPGFDSAVEFAGAFINRPRPSPPGGVTLHSARIGCGAAAAAVAGGGGETPLRAVRGQNEIGKCSECQAGASIASCRFMPAWTLRMNSCDDH